MKISMIISSLVLLAVSACSGLKPDAGYVCKICNDDFITLNGDTFRLQETITPDLLIVGEYPELDGHSYLIQKGHNGLFYMKKESDEMTSIDNSKSLVSLNRNEIYDVETGTQYKLPCITAYMSYLGEWKNLQAFTTGDTICYSDGKCIAMKEDCYCQLGKVAQTVTLVNGARKLTATLGDLYNHKENKATAPIGVKRTVKDFYIKPRNEYESEGIGFSVDLDVPEGETKADVAIREWMSDAIKSDAFSLLGYQKDFKARKSPSYNEFMSALDSYGMFWEKLCRNDYQEEDTLDVRLSCDIRTRMIADTPNYVTYHYWASTYDGGLHGMPRSYYITYDKNRQTLLSAANTVNSSKLVQLRKEVLKALKEWHDDLYEENNSMEEFMQQAFSFRAPIDDEDIDDVLKLFIFHDYECDEWSGWKTSISEKFSLDNFPLPHFALLPEGIVVTYHPYQIGSFAAGEYHAIVPYSKINSCLLYTYHEETDKFPKLDDYVAIITK